MGGWIGGESGVGLRAVARGEGKSGDIGYCFDEQCAVALYPEIEGL